MGCEAVVTVGSAAEALPHTRTPPVTGSTATAGLAHGWDSSQPSYQAITGVAGVLNAELEARDIPSISLRVGIPHYLDERRAPDGRRSSRRHLGHVLDVPTSEWMGGDISNQIDSWREVHDEITETDDQLRMYVRMLEAEFDRRSEAQIPTADDLGDQFEEFLKDQRDD